MIYDGVGRDTWNAALDSLARFGGMVWPRARGISAAVDRTRLWTTGEIRRAEIFVAGLGGSSFLYAEATWSQALPDWISADVSALACLGGVPQQIVSDNLKSGIAKACFYARLSRLVEPGAGETARYGWLPLVF